MAQKITRYLLLALVLTLGFGQLLRFDIFGIPFYLHDLLVIILLPLLFYKVRNLVIPTSLKIVGLGIVLGWIRAVTLYPLGELFIPLLYTLRIVAYLALYCLLASSKQHLSKKVFYLSGLITAFIGLAQYLYLPDMRWAQYLGWDDHLSRLTLPHYDPTYTGIMLVLPMLLATSSQNLSALLLLLPILLTYSRSVWLALLTAFAFTYKSRRLLILGIITLLIAALLLPRRFGEGTNLLRTYSIGSRLTTDLSYIPTLQTDLLFGRGYNTYAISTLSENGFPNHAKGPNNSYLFILATMGIVGMLGWAKFYYELYRRSHYQIAIIFILVAALFNNVLFYPFVFLWLILVETLTVPSEA